MEDRGGSGTSHAQRIEAMEGSAGGCERFAVEGALVVCTQMFEGMSQSQMTPASGVMVNGANELIHTDVEFEPKFEKCRYDYEDCEPDIENVEWHDYSDGNESNGGYGVLEERSFMVCLKGYGLLYVSEDGQRPSEAKRFLAKLAIKFGNRSLLGLLMYAAFGGDPVNMATGNFVFHRTDMEINGHVPLKFTRFYNAFDDHISTLGKGWLHPYDIKLTQSEEGATIRFADGHEELYKVGEENSETSKGGEEQQSKNYRLSRLGETLDDLGGKKYESSDGVFHKLTKVKTGHCLKQTDNVSFYFDEEGRLIKLLDEEGNETILSYENGYLKKVNGICGSFTFTYENGKINSLTDHTGRTVTFDYKEHLLISATDSMGNLRKYVYDEDGRFLSETNPEGNLFVENNYDEENRIIKQTFGDGSGMRYEYDDEAKATIFVAQNGAKTIYYRDDLYRTIGIEHPDCGEERFEFNHLNQKISETDKLGARTYYDFDEKGNIKQIENPLGDITELIYDESNKLISIKLNGLLKLYSEYDNTKNLVLTEDGLKRQIKIAYEKYRKGLPSEITQPDGSIIKLKYDERHNMTEITDPFGIKSYYEYDNLNRVIKTVDGNGNKTLYSYDSNSNIVSVTNAENNVRQYTYNGANQIMCITDFNGGEIKHEYNELNKPSKIINQLGFITTLKYDEMFNISEVILPNEAKLKFIYDECNRLITTYKPDGNTVHYEYDLNGNKTKIVDEAGNPTYLVYDSLSQLIEIRNSDGTNLSFAYNSEGQITSIVDALENVVRLIYDEAGQLIQETNVLGESKHYTYTSLGKVESVTDEIGRVMSYEYEVGGRVKYIHYPDGTKEHFSYDSNGNIISLTNRIEQTTQYRYDCLNRIIQSINPNGGERFYTYDAVSNLTSITDELGNKTIYEYTLAGRLAKVIDALGFETYYSYDELNQLIEIHQQESIRNGLGPDCLSAINGNKEYQRITRYQRNILGKVEAIIDALGQAESYRYSPTGELIEKVDRDGNLTKYSWSDQGDMNHIQYSDGREVKLSYNPLGQLIEVQDWLGTTTIDVDPLGGPKKVTDYQGQEVKYTWGTLGERKQITYPDDKTVDYHYDDMLKLTKVQEGNQSTRYHYDSYGRLTEKQYPNHARTQYQYNEFGQLQGLSHYKGNEQFDRYHYKFNLLGNKIRVDKSREGKVLEENVTYEYEYDSLNRLKRVIKEHYLLREYDYDDFGNIIKKRDQNNQVTYQYNQLNQLVSSEDGQGIIQGYRYDRRGNLTDIYKNEQFTHQYHFGALNRLEYAFNHEMNTGAKYQYNGLGHRIKRSEGINLESRLSMEDVTELVLSSTKHIEDVLDVTKQYHNLLERYENGKKTSFVWDFNVLSAHNEEDLYYLHDDLGSPIRLLNERGMTRDVFDYDEFGGSLYPSFRNQPFTFTGYQKDDISETYFAQAREYVPELKRFMSQDKIAGFVGAPQTLNPYTYCWNQPQSYVDLDGKTAGRPPRPSRQETEHEDLEVWLVHGSFGCPEHYDDEFINYLARRLNIPVENIHVPQWSGDLSISDRRSYGHGIASDINARHGGSSTNVLIVGYSHGGNVARRALNRLHLHYGFDMSNVGFITLGTPMRNDYRLRWGINNNLAFHLNIFNDLDSVQLYGTIHGSPFIGPERPGIIMDGWLPRVVLPGRYAPGATNIRVTNYIPERFDYRYVGVPAHGAMHSNPELWEHYFIDLIVF